MACFNSAVINAPADKVWAALRNFHDMNAFPNVIEQTDAIGDTPGTEIGAQRLLNNAFHETLKSLDDENRVLTYSIDDGPSAVSKDNVKGYTGQVQVFAVTDEDKSFVLWTSSWESSGSEDVATFCNPIYQALLGDLKATFA
jgi:hypothetical protein